MENRRPLRVVLIVLAFAALLLEVGDRWRRPSLPLEPPVAVEPELLNLTFAGDIMAHKAVTSMKDFPRIYKEVASYLKTDDLTFANLETPIVNSQPYHSYPRFSVQEAFVKAAIDGGVDVFALANNHTNDHGETGVKDTLAFFSKQPSDKTYYAGIRKSLLKSLSHSFIEVKGWRVLFVSVSDFSNKSDYDGVIDLIQRSESARTVFKKTLQELRRKYPCDLMVLSYHALSPEYELSPVESVRVFYRSLLQSGVDIVWGGHPHMLQGWEIVKTKRPEDGDKVIIYSLGSLISSQRGKPDFQNPSDIMQYTGDSVLLRLSYDKNFNAKPVLTRVDPVLTTIHRENDGSRVIKPLVKDFTGGEDKKLDRYYNKRLELMQELVKD